MKYRNTRHRGYASKREAQRAADLDLMQRAGLISELASQVKFEVVPKQSGERPVVYVADFVYRNQAGEKVVEDTKGFRTRDYVIKRKLMLWRHGIKIVEI